jgi:hypothetical protein
MDERFKRIRSYIESSKAAYAKQGESLSPTPTPKKEQKQTT